MTTFLFLEEHLREIERIAYTIMREEMGLKFRGKKLLWNNYLYSLRFLLFEDNQRWGFFDAENFEIGIHKDAPDITSILRHELAHLIAFLRTGDLSHGAGFKQVCDGYGWDKSVAKSRMAGKVKKLLSLATSHNVYEAEAAMVKAQEFLLKYGLPETDEDAMVMRRLFHFPRASAKWQSIAKILRTFCVYPVFSRGYLEIFGQRLHIEVAEYVGHFLSSELDRLWKEQTRLKGLAAKNSFYRGIAEGYCRKIKGIQEKSERTLVKVDFALQTALPLAYPHLKTVRSRIVDHKESFNAGQKAGKDLKIHKGLSKGSKKTFRLR